MEEQNPIAPRYPCACAIAVVDFSLYIKLWLPIARESPRNSDIATVGSGGKELPHGGGQRITSAEDNALKEPKSPWGGGVTEFYYFLHAAG
jgi:hypothetical protein